MRDLPSTLDVALLRLDLCRFAGASAHVVSNVALWVIDCVLLDLAALEDVSIGSFEFVDGVQRAGQDGQCRCSLLLLGCFARSSTA